MTDLMGSSNSKRHSNRSATPNIAAEEDPDPPSSQISTPRSSRCTAVTDKTADTADSTSTEPQTASQQSNQENDEEMPPNWYSAVDQSSGKTYYYNAETGETTWKHPGKQ